METEKIVNEIKEKLKGLTYSQIHDIYFRVMSEVSDELVL